MEKKQRDPVTSISEWQFSAKCSCVYIYRKKDLFSMNKCTSFSEKGFKMHNALLYTLVLQQQIPRRYIEIQI